MRHALQALFSAYPAGRAGVALLLLRTVLGVALLIQGTFCCAGLRTALEIGRGVAAIAAGAMLGAGFLTPFSAIMVALLAGLTPLFLAPPCTRTLFDSAVTFVFAATILAAILLLGPGAFSLDARIFGRREIIIPPRDFPDEEPDPALRPPP